MRLLPLGSALVAIVASGCFGSTPERVAIDAAMASSYRATKVRSLHVGERDYDVLAGDLHCHVRPPDGPDATRTLDQTVELAEEEGLDFVLLTPHVPARFFLEAETRASVAASQRALIHAIAVLPEGHPVFIPGFEYTDHAFGHAGVGFANLDEVLAAVPLEEARAHPDRFFQEYVARGGFLIVNHPLVVPLDSSIAMARADLSWRAWTRPGLALPPDVQAIDHLAEGVEAYNLAATYLRDRLLVGDTERTLRDTLHRLDAEILRQRRRLVPTGGSDSHSHHLRATTFVLARGRSRAAIRDALSAGRVCVRSAAACTFEARAPGGPWVAVGGALEGGPMVEVRAAGDTVEIMRDGEAVARPGDGVAARIAVNPGACAVLRAHVDAGFSGPIYVNCDFAR